MSVCAVELKFHGSIFLVTSPRKCPQQVVRVVPVEFGERHDTRTNGSTVHRSRQPADQSGKRVAERGSRPTRRHPRDDPLEETAFVEFKLYRSVSLTNLVTPRCTRLAKLFVKRFFSLNNLSFLRVRDDERKV